ncbi:hypothetical protein [Lacisediminimonas profundi]|uniref:hypothetical protein n=1 Tax=Lacisediminimonas profundi TaxID=2603856 RepID=UPI00124AED66|nr:hypothetical protein [Lacisediminimonas profundi]
MSPAAEAIRQQRLDALVEQGRRQAFVLPAIVAVEQHALIEDLQVPQRAVRVAAIEDLQAPQRAVLMPMPELGSAPANWNPGGGLVKDGAKSTAPGIEAESEALALSDEQTRRAEVDANTTTLDSATADVDEFLAALDIDGLERDYEKFQALEGKLGKLQEDVQRLVSPTTPATGSVDELIAALDIEGLEKDLEKFQALDGKVAKLQAEIQSLTSPATPVGLAGHRDSAVKGTAPSPKQNATAQPRTKKTAAKEASVGGPGPTAAADASAGRQSGTALEKLRAQAWQAKEKLKDKVERARIAGDSAHRQQSKDLHKLMPGSLRESIKEQDAAQYLDFVLLGKGVGKQGWKKATSTLAGENDGRLYLLGALQARSKLEKAAESVADEDIFVSRFVRAMPDLPAATKSLISEQLEKFSNDRRPTATDKTNWAARNARMATWSHSPSSIVSAALESIQDPVLRHSCRSWFEGAMRSLKEWKGPSPAASRNEA